MEKYLTVRFFKRVITFTVLAVILALSVSVIVLSVKVSALQQDAETKPAVSSYLQEESFSYQSRYPQMCIEKEIVHRDVDSKTVFLTFDDGPSANNTVKILNTLKKYDAKATFFIVGEITEEKIPILRRIIDEGHSIGIHSYSHNYEKIYDSVDSYLADFEKLWSQLYEKLGYKAEIYRFPGGSVNNYNYTICQQIIAEMYRRGFVYYDWNASAEDAVLTGQTSSEIKNKIVKGVLGNKKYSIALLHDSSNRDDSAEAVPKIIKALQKKGYTFEKLDRSVAPITFSYLK